MFMQVIRVDKVKDEAGVRKSLDRWQEELRPGATGYLGSTGGFTDDGGMVAIIRFDSEENARSNSDRPEQGEFFKELSSHFDGQPTFIDISDAQEWLGGGSNDAGFVQVMIGKSPDVQKFMDSANTGVEELRKARPEIIGGVYGTYGDNQYVQVVYFTSEAEARDKESSEPPAEVKEMVEEFQRLAGDVAYYDLRDPILH
jgi:hypothetical protein